MKAKHIISSVFILLAFCLLAIIAIPAGAMTPIEAIVQVDCMDIKDSQGSVYNIVLEPMTKSDPKPVNDSLRIAEDGSGCFTIRIAEPGTFKYKLYEKAGSNKHMQYDSTVYTVSVYVQKGADNNLLYSVSVTNGVTTSKMERVEFENIVLPAQETNTTVATVQTVPETYTHDTQVTTVETHDIPDIPVVTDLQTTAPSATDTDVTTDTNGGETGTETVPINPPETDNGEPSEPDSPETSTTTTTTTVETTETTQPPSDESNPVKEYLTSVLTGDRTPIGFLIGGLGIAALFGAGAVLVKRRNDDDDDE